METAAVSIPLRCDGQCAVSRVRVMAESVFGELQDSAGVGTHTLERRWNNPERRGVAAVQIVTRSVAKNKTKVLCACFYGRTLSS